MGPLDQISSSLCDPGILTRIAWCASTPTLIAWSPSTKQGSIKIQCGAESIVFLPKPHLPLGFVKLFSIVPVFVVTCRICVFRDALWIFRTGASRILLLLPMHIFLPLCRSSALSPPVLTLSVMFVQAWTFLVRVWFRQWAGSRSNYRSFWLFCQWELSIVSKKYSQSLWAKHCSLSIWITADSSWSQSLGEP